MTNRIFLIVLFFISYLKTDAQSWKKDIESSIEALNKATISQDGPALEKLTSDDLSYGHSTGLIENKTAYLKNILTGSTKFFQIDIADQTIILAGNNVIVRNISSFRGTTNGAPLDIRIGVLMVWNKEGDNWKLLARQGYKLPQTN